MKPPLPGMDPYLEGHLWPDVHHSLAFMIKELLVPQLPEAYLVQTEVYTVVDTAVEKDLGIMYPAEVVDPDVEVMRRKMEEPPGEYASSRITPSTLLLPSPQPIEVRIPQVEIRDRQHHRLITAIEILSPVNKRSPGLEPYRAKRVRLHEAGVNLLEIDLLRRGERPLQHRLLPASAYLVSLARATSAQVEVWAISLADTLPVLPVPLLEPDADLILDLGEALRTIYQRSQYQRSIDYTQAPPPPTLTEAESAWLREQLREAI